MLSILPACATVTGLLVLAQRPTARDLLGVALVIVAIAIHHPRQRRHKRAVHAPGFVRPLGG